MLAPMRIPLLVTVAATALALATGLPAAGAGTSRQAALKLSCAIGGATTVTGITARHVHFRFRWWYADGSSYTATAKVWPDTQGTAWIPTHGAAVRAEAIEHRFRTLLAHVRSSCS